MSRTNPIEPPDSFCLSAAIGWMELGNLAEASREWEGLSPAGRTHPTALEVRWRLCAERRDWSAALQVAGQLLEVAPDQPAGYLHQAYAARRAPGGSVQAAWNILRSAADRFPEHELIAFNLACYACRLDRLDEARHWLKRAFQAGDPRELKTMALGDEDLQLLWPEIQSM